MKLHQVTIENAIGCRRFAANLGAVPVTLIAGPNGAGKTSIIQSLRLALTGDMPRVSLKKDAGKLVTDGAKSGRIRVEWNDGLADVALPSVKLTEGKAGDIHPVLPYLCEPHRFAAADDTARRQLLFGLANIQLSGDAVRADLIARGHDEARVDMLVPLLRSGFPAAQKDAERRATEARGAWKAVTGETYGSNKAEGWKPDLNNGPTVHPDAETWRKQLPGLQQTIADTQQSIGAARQQHEAARLRAANIEGLREKAAALPRLIGKLEADEAEHDRLKALVAEAERHQKRAPTCACPECGASLQIDGDKVIVYTREPGDDTAADNAEQLGELRKSLDLMTRCVANDRRDIAAAEAAAAQVAEAEKDAGGELPDIGGLEQLLAEQKTTAETWRQAIAVADDVAKAEATAKDREKKAAGYHADVLAWSGLAGALSPDGLPGEKLAKALQPINITLAQSAADTGWQTVTIAADMEILAAGRPYALLSESEQWRVDAMLAHALAVQSGVGILLLDRLDVLGVEGRAQALGWLDVIAEAGEINTAVVAATLKAIPAGLPQSFAAVWIEGGQQSEVAKLAA